MGIYWDITNNPLYTPTKSQNTGVVALPYFRCVPRDYIIPHIFFLANRTSFLTCIAVYHSEPISSKFILFSDCIVLHHPVS